ncbi:MAG: hypothetical protein KBF37_09605 [Saprospiraceae bacterium]|jgi:hypothetical protein|nr:hypothetical protein [Saprospiraceae bacterium]MBP9210562.1 hypothetical protein [Saprospiraceae bacterium]
MLVQLVYWSLVGWCGTPPRPWPFPPPPPGPPDPWWMKIGLGIAGGIAGGLLVKSGLGFEDMVATSFGAFAGGRIFSDVAGMVMSKPTA